MNEHQSHEWRVEVRDGDIIRYAFRGPDEHRANQAFDAAVGTVTLQFRAPGSRRYTRIASVRRMPVVCP